MNGGERVVALVRDDGLRIVVLGDLERFANGGDALEVFGGKAKRLGRHLLAFEELDGVPAGLAGLDAASENVGDLAEGVFHLIGKAELGRRGARLCGSLLGGIQELVYAASLEGRNLDDGAAEVPAELGDVDGVPVLLDEVHHVEGDCHRHAQVDDLGGEVEVALEVGGVHDVDDDVGMPAHQVVAGDDLFGRIGRQGIDARQVGDANVFSALAGALLLLNGHTGPVANVLAGSGEIVEQCRLAAVRVAGKSNVECHASLFLSFLGAFPRFVQCGWANNKLT